MKAIITFYFGLIFLQCFSQSWSCGDTLTDERDEQKYTTVQISDQCWMGQNLNVGTRIDIAQNATDNDTIEKYCYYDEPDSCELYGGLYRWEETVQWGYLNKSIQGICPQGWHMPSHDEWMELKLNLGGGTVAGGQLKDTNSRYWYYPNTGATNSSGFTGLGAGRKNGNGVCQDIRRGFLVLDNFVLLRLLGIQTYTMLGTDLSFRQHMYYNLN